MSDRRILATYRNIILLILAALLLYAGFYKESYWLHWIGGVIAPGALLVLAVYLLPKRPWQD